MSLIIREKQIKTALRFHLISSQNGYHQENEQWLKLAWKWGRKNPSFIAGENMNLCGHYGNQDGVFSKKLEL